MTDQLDVLAIFATALAEAIDNAEGNNYVEATATHPVNGRKFILTVQHFASPTPHQLRQRAEAERDAALDDRDIWSMRWRMLMAEYKRTERERARLAATVQRVKVLLGQWENTIGLANISKQFARELRAALKGQDS